MRIPIQGGRVTKVRLIDVDTGVREIPFQAQPNAVEFAVPEVRIYRIAEVSIVR